MPSQQKQALGQPLYGTYRLFCEQKLSR